MFVLVAVVDGGILPALRFFFGLLLLSALVLAALVGWVAYQTWQSEPDAAPSRQLARPDAIADFTRTISAVAAAGALSTSEKQTEMLKELEQARTRLSRQGQLTPQVSAEFTRIVLSADRKLHDQYSGFGTGLHRVLSAYQPLPPGWGYQRRPYR